MKMQKASLTHCLESGDLLLLREELKNKFNRRLFDRVFLPALAAHDEVSVVGRVLSDTAVQFPFDKVFIVPTEHFSKQAPLRKWTDKVFQDVKNVLLPEATKSVEKPDVLEYSPLGRFYKKPFSSAILCSKPVTSSVGNGMSFVPGPGVLSSGVNHVVSFPGMKRRANTVVDNKEQHKRDARLLAHENAMRLAGEGSFSLTFGPKTMARFFYPNLEAAGFDCLPERDYGFVRRVVEFDGGDCVPRYDGTAEVIIYEPLTL